ncbi:MAG: hypothetical protein JNG83_14095 [Opitutaceae bacterium]|nr:hypothetical protein [Opitutaceae bacterium]
MPPSVSRRRFVSLAAQSAVLGAASLSAVSSAPSTPAAPPRGIWRVQRNPRALRAPLDVPPGETWRHYLGFPFQVGPHVAGLYVNRKNCDFQGTDFGGGNDIILFDDSAKIDPARGLPISRLRLAPNPHDGGRPAILAPYPGSLGFVPFGARLADGRPHPHAGTGFILINLSAWPVDGGGNFETYPDRIGRTWYRDHRRYHPSELIQIGYDGTRLAIISRQPLEEPEILPGYHSSWTGLGCAIADGEDLLIGMQASRPGDPAARSGIARWRRTEGAWRAVEFTPITPADNSIEASLVRDLDGSLIYFARGRRHLGPPARLWRQARPGGEWELRCDLPRMLPSTPAVLGQAVDGTPYLAGNLWQPEYRLPAGLYADAGVSRLEPVGWRGERSTLCVWPLNEARDGFEAPLIARDPRTEFGLPPHGTLWAADHPVSNQVRLADGQWHTLMSYRMLEWKENTHFIPPSPQTGCYLDEVVSFGPPRPLWNF